MTWRLKKIVAKRRSCRNSMSDPWRRQCVEREFPIVEGESVTPLHGQGDDRRNAEKGNTINWRDWGGRS